MVAGPLLVIVGPTASGKTALSIELAKKYNGEIVCADSRTVYKGLTIGTAKPTAQEQQEVPHHLLDVVHLDEIYTAVNFKAHATSAIDDILSRGKLPILVGGSGLYIDALLYDFKFSPKGAKRDSTNSRHANKEIPQERSVLRSQTLILGLTVDRQVLRGRIEKRVRDMLKNGLVHEVEELVRKYPQSKALDAPGYKAMVAYLKDELSLDKATERFIINDYQLAKRQVTWFKRNKDIRWLNTSAEADVLVTTHMNKKS